MKTKLLIPLLMLATLLPIAQGFSANATIASGTKTELTPWTVTTPDDNVMLGYGLCNHAIQVDSASTAARSQKLVEIMPATDMSAYDKVWIWVQPVALGDSLFTIATDTDTGRVIFETSYDQVNWIKNVTGTNGDTVITAVTKRPTFYTANDSVGTYNRKAIWVRCRVHYNLAVGKDITVVSVPATGLYNQKYAYGFKAWRDQ